MKKGIDVRLINFNLMLVLDRKFLAAQQHTILPCLAKN